MSTLHELVEEFCDACESDGLSHHTVASYRQTLVHFTTWIPDDTRAVDVTHKTIRAFISSRRKAGEADTTVAGRHASLSAFWSYLLREAEHLPSGDPDKVTDNVVKRVSRPAAKIPVTPIVDADGMRKLLALEGRTPFLTVRNRAILMVLWDCGVRVGELCNLREEDVDFDRMMLSVDGKTGPRDVPFGKATKVELKRYLKARRYHPKAKTAGYGSLFIGARGDLSEGMVTRVVKDYGKRAGLGNLFAHMFRHSWVHALLEAGATILDVTDLGGWSSPEQVLKRYGIVGRHSRAVTAHRRLSPGDRLAKTA